MLRISRSVVIPDDEIELTAVRAQGPGGQHVNKVASAIHLRFDFEHSSLPEELRERLRRSADRRIGRDGVITIKAQRYRTQNRNRDDALARLRELLAGAFAVQRKRIATRPGRAAQQRRLEHKSKQGERKRQRARVRVDD